MKQSSRSAITKPKFDYYNREMLRALPSSVASRKLPSNYGIGRSTIIKAEHTTKSELGVILPRYNYQFHHYMLDADNPNGYIENEMTRSMFINTTIDGEIYSYNNGRITHIYIIDKGDPKLKEIITQQLNIHFPSKLGGAAKSKKYVLYNNKRRLVKINAENKKYIVCDRTDILLSTIKGKFRYILD